MRIGIDGRFLAARPSGNEVFSQMLIAHLALHASEHQFTVYMTRDFNLVRQNNVMLKRMRRVHGNAYLRFLLTFPVELKRNPVDVFHAIFSVPYRVPCKVVLSLMEFFCITAPELFPANPVARSQFALMTRYSIRKADRIIVPTNHVRKRLVESFDLPGDSVEVVPLGVSPHFLEPLSRKEIDRVLVKYSIDRPYLLFVGNLHSRKNIERLIQCYNMIREEENLPLQLVLAGEKHWKYRRIVKQVTMSPYREGIRMTGYIPLKELRALYQGARLFVFPSLEEGFGIPPLEAMASNIPVAAANTSSIPEVVGDAAVLFAPLDVRDMKRTLVEAVQNESTRDMLIERGQKRVREFSWDRSARRVVSIYEEVASQ